MKINKQLFEDVLSGKLKGTFVTTNGTIISSDKIQRNINKKSDFPYQMKDNLHKEYSTSGVVCPLYSYHFDLVNFIPDTDMKQNELAIEIPDGKMVDWDESKKQNKIILKDKQLTYVDICKKLNGIGFYIDDDGSIISGIYGYTANFSTTKHQLECILAKNKLANVCKFLNGNIDYSTIEGCWNFDILNKIIRITYYRPQEPNYYQPQFVCKSKEIAEQAIEILGEETVKLALEPLGI